MHPSAMGVYGWWLRGLPAIVPLKGTERRSGHNLVYVGTGTSKRPLRERMRNHLGNDARCSTFRKTIGCLLEYPMVVAGPKFKFSKADERSITKWMYENALIFWLECRQPVKFEDNLIDELSLPLNIKGNRDHPFYPVLWALRESARDAARAKHKKS